MYVEIFEVPTQEQWDTVKRFALSTMGAELQKPVDSEWKQKLINSEHSPLYELKVTWAWHELPTWVSVHFVRHKIGCNHFVQSQRNDNQYKYDRNAARQDTPVTHIMAANLAEIITISRKRLCSKASPETRRAWQAFLKALKIYEPELFNACVPNCIYRNGICGEFKPCNAPLEGIRKEYLKRCFNVQPDSKV